MALYLLESQQWVGGNGDETYCLQLGIAEITLLVKATDVPTFSQNTYTCRIEVVVAAYMYAIHSMAL